MRLDSSKISSTPRRGITLIFVVTMIVLFLLMGTTFVLVSNDYFRAARKRASKHIYDKDRQATLERAFYDLVRGPALTDSSSPLRGHSLLADMYGYGISATVATAAADSSEHFVVLTLNGDATRLIDGETFVPEAVSGSMTGLVMGVVSGPARGLTARIIDHQVADGEHTFIVLPSQIDSRFNVTDAQSQLVSRRVVINGRPFSGTGAGEFKSYVGVGAPAIGGDALEPNQTGRSRAQLVGETGGGYLAIQDNRSAGWDANSSAPNEPYDTFDFQNMFLAGINPDGSLKHSSFHRPGLLSSARGDFRALKNGGPRGDGISVDNNNDGEVDGIWMDIGLPKQARSDGVLVKPLVSYLVVDLDGRINLNAHGNLLQLPGESKMTSIPLLPDMTEAKRGQGYGPPEVRIDNLISNAKGVMLDRYGSDGLPGDANSRDRWSEYKLFGYPNVGFGAEVPGTVSGHFGSAMDVFGRFSVGYPEIRDVSDPDVAIGLPVSDVADSFLKTEVMDSPYEMSFAASDSTGAEAGSADFPYSAKDLERLLRPFDVDSKTLSPRLIDLGLSVNGRHRHSVGTHSYEVPTSFENLPIKLAKILGDDDQLSLMLPPEVFRGLPMNVNRPFGDGIDNNGNGVTDEMGEVDSLVHPNGATFLFDHDNDSVVTGDPDSLFARIQFARHLYIVTLLNTEKIDRNGDGVANVLDWYDFNEDGKRDANDLTEFRKVIAQWVANVVDFRDRDSIMTPFVFDLNPWDGWDVDGSIFEPDNGIAPNMRFVVWGAERPELLITETLATHDRRTQNLEQEDVVDGETAAYTNGQQAQDPQDEDFDSHLVPKVSAFFELYNPWVMNDANQIRPRELYDAGLNGVDLQKTSPDGTSPVWRLVVTETDEETLDPDDATRNPNGKSITPVRRIYFARPSFTVDFGPEVYFPEDGIKAGFVGPGRYAVVGTAGQKVGKRFDNYFGRRITPGALDADELQNMTRRISLDPANEQIEIVQWDPDTSEMKKFNRSAVNLPIGLNDGGWERELGVSDPIEGYAGLTGVGTIAGGLPIGIEPVADGLKFTENVTTPGTPMDYAFDEPIDKRIDPDHYQKYLQHDGLADAEDDERKPYRVVHLQRLANPLLAFNETSNPYRTIDTCSIDLFAFNGVNINSADADPNMNEDLGAMRFGTHERRGSAGDYGQDADRNRLLFKSDHDGLQGLDDYPQPEDCDNFFDLLDSHVLSWNLIESLGGLNVAYRVGDGFEFEKDKEPFCWLTWSNRPYVSQLELANVPFTSSYWMTRVFDMSADAFDGNRRDVFKPMKLDDFKSDHPNVECQSYASQYSHLLNFYADQVEGTSFGPGLHRVFDFLEVPSRFAGTETYVNPATFNDDDHEISFGFASPFDKISNYRYPGKVNINTVLDPEVWNSVMGGYSTDLKFKDWVRSRDGGVANQFRNPYRPAVAANRAPNGYDVMPSQCGLFRLPSGEYSNSDSELPVFDFFNSNFDQRAAYFRNDMRQRLGNLVTTRSSVFAIWITVGYFETGDDGKLKVPGVEAGSQVGDVYRSRGFFLLDRSIPVSFEPGKNHNVDRAVLLKSFIE